MSYVYYGENQAQKAVVSEEAASFKVRPRRIRYLWKPLYENLKIMQRQEIT